jgi:hypothetical protein
MPAAYTKRRLACCAVAFAIGLTVPAVVSGAPDNAESGSAEAKQFGFNGSPIASQYGRQVALNAPLRRMIVNWQTVQPTGSGAWKWANYDESYSSVVSAGLKPLIVVVGSPCWSHPTTCRSGGWHQPAARFDPDWGEFVRRVAARYQEAVAIEVWNEPNLDIAFPGSPTRYADLLVGAYRAVKAATPGTPVISGGLAPATKSGTYAMADSTFLSRVYSAGARGYMDGIGTHPYPKSTAADGTKSWNVAASLATLDRIRAVRNAAGDGATPLWITEIGEATASQSGFPPAASESQQAEDLVTLVRAIREMPDVPVAILHKLMDTDPSLDYEYAGVEAGFGLYRVNGSAKPAACALSGEFGGSLPCTTVLP